MRTSALIFLAALALPACAPNLDSTEPASCNPGETEPCYSGAPATRDVGMCQAGSRTCKEDGSGFGACEGEVVPQIESCGSSEDVDCNGATQCAGGAVWKLELEGDNVPTGIAASSDGEAAVFGWTPASQLFVRRIGNDGSSPWIRTFDGFEASEHAGGIAMTEAHEAIVVVQAKGTVTLDGVTIDASPEGVIAMRLADDGTVSAADLVDLSGPAGLLPPVPRVLRLAPGGGAITAGDGFLARLDGGLDTTWHHRYSGDIVFADLTFGGDALFAVGSYKGPFEPGGGAEEMPVYHAGFVAELDGPDWAWSQTLGGDKETSALSVLVRQDGTLRLAGTEDPLGSLVEYIDLDQWTAWEANRNEYGLIKSRLLGWGPRRPESITIDASGDMVVRAMGTDEWSPSVVFKGPTAGNLTAYTTYWAQMFQWPPVSVTLWTGETIVATQKSVQKLAK